MTKEEAKTPEELAEEEVNKLIGKSIASRKLEIKQHRARIKKLEKEIKKIIDGELVPDEGECSPSDSKDIIIRPNIIINNPEKKKKDKGYEPLDWGTSPGHYWYSDSTTDVCTYGDSVTTDIKVKWTN